MRNHEPIIIEEFNGLWKRGDKDSCPIDHFTDCNNVAYIESGVETRSGIDTLIAKGNVLRIYNYVMLTGDSFLILDTNGDIYHALLDGSETVYGPILIIPEMEDFAFVAINGFAFISPFNSEDTVAGISKEVGLENEFTYIYKGDGIAARKAAGFPPSNSDDTPLVAYNSQIDGNVDQGIHVIGVTFSEGGATDSTSIGTSIKPVIYAPGGKEVVVNNLPIGGVTITERRIWMTRAIDPKDWNPDTTSYTYYLAATVSNNTATDAIVSIADANLTTPFAAGALANPTTGGLEVENSDTEGYSDLGLHVIGVVYETDTGYLTAPGPEVLGVQTFVNERRKISITNIPVSPDSFVVGRRLVASKAISLYNGDDKGYQLYFIPSGNIEDNTTTSIELSFFDADLLEDASHLIDNFSEIPAFASLSRYHNRLVGCAEFDNISLARLSAVDEPEAINQIDGLIVVEPDGNALTNAQEFRDILYLFKQTKTVAYADNGDEPVSWNPSVLDSGIGASIHGVATVLDSNGVNIDFLLIIDYSGLMLFNGIYARPELTWKIHDLWFALDKTDFRNIQIMNDSLNQIIYITLPDRQMLMANYENGLDAKSIKWTPWTFDVETTTIALYNKDTLAIGSETVVV
jgi:hypothetical protein